jgi:hypothetical protein
VIAATVRERIMLIKRSFAAGELLLGERSINRPSGCRGATLLPDLNGRVLF